MDGFEFSGRYLGNDRTADQVMVEHKLAALAFDQAEGKQLVGHKPRIFCDGTQLLELEALPQYRGHLNGSEVGTGQSSELGGDQVLHRVGHDLLRLRTQQRLPQIQWMPLCHGKAVLDMGAVCGVVVDCMGLLLTKLMG